MFGGALGLLFSRRYDEDAPWLSVRPDLAKYAQLKAEMDERDSDDYDEPPRRRKDDSDVHPWLRYGIRVGLPAALGTAVVAWVLHDATGNMKTIIDLQRQAIQQNSLMQQEHAMIRERIDRTDRMQESVIALLRADCVNSARTYEARQACLQAGR